MSCIRRDDKRNAWKCLQQPEVYAQMVPPIKEVDFQSNPYFNVKTNDEMRKLNRRVRCTEPGGGRGRNRIRDNMWYHNNSADFGSDTLYNNPAVNRRNIYYNNYDYGVGLPYYTTKYLRYN